MLWNTALARRMSHELRTPLTALRLNVDQLRRGGGPPLSDRQEEMVRRIATASERLHEVIESLLAYAQIVPDSAPPVPGEDRVGPGVCVGPFLVKELVGALGGRIEPVPGSSLGSAFTVILPASGRDEIG